MLAGRRSGPTRVWTAAGLVNAIAAMVVLVFFLGRGTVEWGGMWPFIVVYGVTILGLAGLGQREILSGTGDEGFVGAAYEKCRESGSSGLKTNSRRPAGGVRRALRVWRCS